MVLLRDFLKCFDFEHISCSDVLKRLNLYYKDFDDEKGFIYLPFDYVGFTAVFSDSPDVDFKFLYLFCSRSVRSSSPYLFDYDFSRLLNSVTLYCRPKRAWRDWFENVLLPH